MNELDEFIIAFRQKLEDSNKSYKSIIYGNKEAKKNYNKIKWEFKLKELKKTLKSFETKKKYLKKKKDYIKNIAKKTKGKKNQ